ncbi:hypothetical protein GRI65_00770 [Altererythrobacter sediminis]|uniref:Uncharacterized protein n=2 Tax=Allopontixanthobacter sediminis TaxID=1689985 RepID=A0A845ATU7_9SPHN|nr:hypothetical protein [Allopontixanthobacter sediminis]
MFDQAFASIAVGFSDAFGGPFTEATANWPGVPVYDDGGSIVTPGVPAQYPCRAQFDAATQSMRLSEGFLETDVRVLVLSASLSVPLDTEAKIIVSDGMYSGTWALKSCGRDPAGVGYECRARRL